MATETRAQVKLLFSVRDVVDNAALDAVVQKELERVGPPVYDAQELAFARALQKELGPRAGRHGPEGEPVHAEERQHCLVGLGEVSAVVPLAELAVATRPLGTVAHHWAQTSCAAHPIGFKGMEVAAKVLAASAIDLLTDPATVASAREDFRKATDGKPYQSPLAPDAKPQASR